MLSNVLAIGKRVVSILYAYTFKMNVDIIAKGNNFKVFRGRLRKFIFYSYKMFLTNETLKILFLLQTTNIPIKSKP